MTTLRLYYLPDTGEQLSCYIAPNGIIKLKVSGKGYDLIVGIGRNVGVGLDSTLSKETVQIEVPFSQIAAQFADAIFAQHTQGMTCGNVILHIIKGGEHLPKDIKDLTEGWVMPV